MPDCVATDRNVVASIRRWWRTSIMLDDASIRRSQLCNKVPEVTIFFWIIKVLCTTVGETAADFLNVNLNFGLTGTSIVTGILLAVALIVQFKTVRYVAVVYWLAVVLISIFGTLLTDNLTDVVGFPLEQSTALFSALLLITFAIWYRQERSLSIQSIFTVRREAFYWLAVLFTFALGTAAGDLMAEALGLGYATTGILVALIVAIFAVAWRLGLNSILAFWVIYIMTRPLGASLGDYLTQSRAHGALGLGATTTTTIFALAIFGTVLYLALTESDVARENVAAEKRNRPLIFAQVVVVAFLFAAASIGGYLWQSHRLLAERQVATDTNGDALPLGDLSSFHEMTQATFDSINAGDWSGANDHADEIEYAWDQAEFRLKPMNTEAWANLDDAIDEVLREIRAIRPDQIGARSALQKLQSKIANP
jgi:uncharacterized membrane-anchored protein